MQPRVIVIDGEPNVRVVLSDFLILHDVDVLATGNNGKDAVELYKKHQPDVVLMDINMPDYDGFYALEHLYSMNSDVKVIILTSSMLMDVESKLAKFDVSAILEKPYGLDSLVTTINNVILNDLTPLA